MATLDQITDTDFDTSSTEERTSPEKSSGKIKRDEGISQLLDELSKKGRYKIKLKSKPAQFKESTEEFNDRTNYLELFKHKKFLTKEDWEKTYNIEAKVIKVTKSYVDCECLMDKNQKYFETRRYPIQLFSHLKDLNENPYVLISMQLKEGASRIDVYKGNMVNKSHFEFESVAESLEDLVGDNKMEGPIEL